MSLITAEPVRKEFVINEDEPPLIVNQVKINTVETEIYLDPDQVIDLINHLEFSLREINGE